jgi:formylglycine-generating enzyme
MNFLITVFRFIALSIILLTQLAAKPNEEKTSSYTSKLGVEFVALPGGCFKMGSDLLKDFEQPIHEACVDSFYIGKYEITQKQWNRLMDSNPSKFLGENHPVDRVSWLDSKAFIDRLNKFENTNRYRFATEAEWEYAARAGSQTEYYWGPTIDNDYAWYYGTANYHTHPVGLKKPNAFGLYDMSGNLWEWVNDWFHKDYYKKKEKNNPKGPDSGKFRVRRGGSWANFTKYIRSASRYRGRPDHKHHIMGFRIAFTNLE